LLDAARRRQLVQVPTSARETRFDFNGLWLLSDKEKKCQMLNTLLNEACSISPVTSISRESRQCYLTSISLSSRQYFTRPWYLTLIPVPSSVPCIVAPVSRQYLTSISPVSHQYLTSTSPSPLSHQYLTRVSPVLSHQYLIIVSPVSHQTLVSHHDPRSLLTTGLTPRQLAEHKRIAFLCVDGCLSSASTVAMWLTMTGLGPQMAAYASAVACERPGAAELQTLACLCATDRSRCTRALLSARWPGQAPAIRTRRATSWRRYGRASTSPRATGTQATFTGAGISLIASLSLFSLVTSN